jgi:DUF1016 N-terminal domain
MAPPESPRRRSATTAAARPAAKKPKAVAAKAKAMNRLDRPNPEALLGDLRTLVQAARQRIATVASVAHTLLCWQIGRRVLAENPETGRAAHGEEILGTVSQQLSAEFGAGFSCTALTRMACLANSIRRRLYGQMKYISCIT